MKKKIIWGVVLVGILSVVGIWLFVFILPSSKLYKDFKRKEAYKNAIAITAKDLVKDFQVNENAAYKKYTGKDIVLEITGEVISEKMENGHPNLLLKSDDPFSNVSVTLLEYNQDIKNGSTVSVKGICTGFLSDVEIIEGIVTKQ